MATKTIACAVALLLAFSNCSDPVEPPPPPLATSDTTTHSYDWQFYGLGTHPVSSSVFFDVYVESDSSIWMVGDVRIDSTILTTPQKLPRNMVNAVHWDGTTFTPYALEGVKMGDRIGILSLVGVVGHSGSTFFISGLGCVEYTSDTLVFHDLRSLAGLWYANERTELTKSGRHFIFGKPGFLAELSQSERFSPIQFEQVPVPTEVPVVAIAEIGPDEFYIACRGNTSSERAFYHQLGGSFIEYDFQVDSVFPGNICYALWSSEDRVFGACTPYIFSQSILDTSDRVFINILEDVGYNSSLGFPNRMTGRANNDIFIVGSYGTVLHYNGATCHLYQEIQSVFPSARFYDVSIHGNKVYIVGAGIFNGMPRALLIVGTKNA